MSLLSAILYFVRLYAWRVLVFLRLEICLGLYRHTFTEVKLSNRVTFLLRLRLGIRSDLGIVY